jgi:hypothetical protein
MAALTDLSDLINRATGGNSGTPETVFFQKLARIGGAAATALIAGRPASLWRYDGVNWPGGAIPGAVAAPTRATTGALLGWTNPGGGREKHVIQAWGTGLVAGTMIVYDRLLQYNGVGNVNTAQTVGGALTRNTGGVGNFAFMEIGTQIGTTATTVSMSYTNEAGTTGRTSPSVAIGNTGFREATRAIMLPLQAGDHGIQAVASFTLAASTGTAGNVSLVVGKPLAYIGIGAPGDPGFRDFIVGMPGVPKIDTDACIAALWIPNTTTVPEIFGGISTVEA